MEDYSGAIALFSLAGIIAAWSYARAAAKHAERTELLLEVALDALRDAGLVEFGNDSQGRPVLAFRLPGAADKEPHRDSN